MFATDDTIVAIATPHGHAGIGVVRISGPDATRVAAAMLSGAGLKPRLATLRRLRDAAGAAGAADRVVATFFPAPASYTGDDVVEISAHGSPVILEAIVEGAGRAGARLARPGEFTLRAYLNGKMDLMQAEAVADLVEAVTPAQARLAVDQLNGTLGDRLGQVSRQLFDLRVRLEASLDFPDEGYHFIDRETLIGDIGRCRREVDTLLSQGRWGRLIREGRTVVVIGPPNAGKSSLFNALLRSQRAIVAPEAGTTRDALSEKLDIGGLPVTLVDTAGLRPGGGPIEQEGMRRARAAAQGAAMRVVVLDCSRPLETQDWSQLSETARPRVIVANKADLPAVWSTEALGTVPPPVVTSVVTGEGIAATAKAIRLGLTGGDEQAESPSLSNVRHLALLERCSTQLDESVRRVQDGASEEVVLLSLLEAERALEETVGRRTSDDLLTAIFSRFCIGK